MGMTQWLYDLGEYMGLVAGPMGFGEGNMYIWHCDCGAQEEGFKTPSLARAGLQGHTHLVKE